MFIFTFEYVDKKPQVAIRLDGAISYTVNDEQHEIDILGYWGEFAEFLADFPDFPLANGVMTIAFEEPRGLYLVASGENGKNVASFANPDMSQVMSWIKTNKQSLIDAAILRRKKEIGMVL